MANPSRPADHQLSEGVSRLEHRIWEMEANRREDQRKIKVLQEDLSFCREKRRELESLIAELRVEEKGAAATLRNVRSAREVVRRVTKV